MSDQAHEVFVLCDCGNVLDCKMERYVSDVRIAVERIRQLEALYELAKESSQEC